MNVVNNRYRRCALAILLLTTILLNSTRSAAEENPYYIEVESLFPMFLMGGYHLAIGVRKDQWRLRASCIDGGNYNYEPNSSAFKRNLGKGCGIFLGYFFSPGWHAYLFIERQEYIVTRRDTGTSATFPVTDIGPGIGYQYFFNKKIYLQPALHLYWRKDAKKNIGGINYTLPNFDFSPTLRLGYRF